ncbi:MAG: helix-turn-helix domain-containing protein, partial [Acidimicrobiales bacterium]
MGYRGKVTEQERARELRAAGWTYNEICAELGVCKSSVSLWVRDIPVDEEVWAKRVRKNKRYGA